MELKADKFVFDESQSRRFLAIFSKNARIFLRNMMARNSRNLDRGLDADGNPLRKTNGGQYKPSYKKQIEYAKDSGTGTNDGRAGLSTKNPEVTDLTITGTLRNSQRVQGEKGKVGITLAGDHYGGLSNAELARAHEKRGFTNWYSIADADIPVLDKMVDITVGLVLDNAFKVRKK